MPRWFSFGQLKFNQQWTQIVFVAEDSVDKKCDVLLRCLLELNKRQCTERVVRTRSSLLLVSTSSVGHVEGIFQDKKHYFADLKKAHSAMHPQ